MENQEKIFEDFSNSLLNVDDLINNIVNEKCTDLKKTCTDLEKKCIILEKNNKLLESKFDKQINLAKTKFILLNGETGLKNDENELKFEMIDQKINTLKEQALQTFNACAFIMIFLQLFIFFYK